LINKWASLRSWALNSISVKASEYLSFLNTKIQRISLSEKARDVSIACYSKTEVLELESLSGGEKVSVALALRLGMASLLGSSNLNLISSHMMQKYLKIQMLNKFTNLNLMKKAVKLFHFNMIIQLFQNCR